MHINLLVVSRTRNLLGQRQEPIAGFLAGKVGEGELRLPELPALRVSHAPRRPVLPQALVRLEHVDDALAVRMDPLGVVGADEGAEEGLEDRGAEGLGRRRAAAVEESVRTARTT